LLIGFPARFRTKALPLRRLKLPAMFHLIAPHFRTHCPAFIPSEFRPAAFQLIATKLRPPLLHFRPTRFVEAGFGTVWPRLPQARLGAGSFMLTIPPFGALETTFREWPFEARTRSRSEFGASVFDSLQLPWGEGRPDFREGSCAKHQSLGFQLGDGSRLFSNIFLVELLGEHGSIQFAAGLPDFPREFLVALAIGLHRFAKLGTLLLVENALGSEARVRTPSWPRVAARRIERRQWASRTIRWCRRRRRKCNKRGRKDSGWCFQSC
jgi:hypothetical protein